MCCLDVVWMLSGCWLGCSPLAPSLFFGKMQTRYFARKGLTIKLIEYSRQHNQFQDRFILRNQHMRPYGLDFHISSAITRPSEAIRVMMIRPLAASPRGWLLSGDSEPHPGAVTSRSISNMLWYSAADHVTVTLTSMSLDTHMHASDKHKHWQEQ